MYLVTWIWPPALPYLPKLAREPFYGLASFSPSKAKTFFLQFKTVKFQPGQMNKSAGVLPEVEVLEGELGLDDASGFDTRTQHILLSGHISWSHQTL